MITLTNDYLTGVAKIDHQHKELINRINAVMEMGSKSISSDEMRKTLDFLGEYIIKHFSDEESLQRSANYPKHEAHKKMHQGYIAEFKKLREEFVTNGATPKFAVSLNHSIVSWILSHIKNTDTDFGRYYKALA